VAASKLRPGPAVVLCMDMASYCLSTDTKVRYLGISGE